MIGQRIKKAIEKSDISAEQVAAHADMSMANLYKIFKRDSVESRYLVKIAEVLNLPYSYFLDEDQAGFTNTGQSNYAHRVGSNQQSIKVGDVDDCPQKLEALQGKYELLQQVVAEKERTIEILMGKK